MALRRTSKRQIFDRSEQRRWCIEMALRWRMIGSGNHPGFSDRQPPSDPQREVDLIARADRILKWVSSV
jgi:hypothetical protein